MMTFFLIARALRLVLITLRTVASILIIGTGTMRWAKNQRKAIAR